MAKLAINGRIGSVLDEAQFSAYSGSLADFDQAFETARILMLMKEEL